MTMKQAIFDHLPPATLFAIWAIFGFAPAAWIEDGWLFALVAFGSMFFIQAMELVHERHEGWRITGREFATDMFYMVLVIFFIGLVTETYVDGTLLKAKEALGIATPWITQLPFLVQVFMVMLIFEFGQYWMHRFMHNNELLWSTHAPHHHVTQLNALKGFVGNPIELFLISLGVIALFDFDLNALLAAFLSLGAIAQYAHANIRSDPPAWYAFFFTTIRHHSLHHTALSYEDTRCNYGNSVILWDRLFGTFREGESEVVGQDDRRRLSILEQFAFPYTYFRAKRRQRLAGE
ncbi:sterol desaturase family protein [Erythrobacter sp.]|jgi:sterol desaturase/sphingolipid hydroxylase (fatty acid hydroxylase superfamily)|uniref:sterol desaturase family protein n=1 Tax=Erythrobacter sp. TaxID=1042 RepID=UPI002ECD3DA0|nr:sterol desaturase family protein [Erythrobacter sp.]